ncbi:HAD family hydrolase [Clostridium sp. JN-9]|uniref:HAD family hydrolase n=1 Tax=Clostridium sp. JN-9 TaxID=2507159 RepID=UPI000FFE2D66|nr:HAD family hydrolase [Clostridium sp. JN-9]QAT39172.1 HAD family hydrolase [Clostridium sp. JN-9]
MYKSIIFDVDGTLIDTEEGILVPLQRVVKEELNQDKKLDELKFSLGLTDDIALGMLNIKNIKGASDKWRKYIKEYSHLIKVYSGIEEVLRKLNELDVYTGIVTSRTKQEIIDDLYPFMIHRYMKTIISADDSIKHKPEPDPILEFIKVSRIDPSSAIYIGDTIYDMKCANSAGIDFALALWGAKTAEGINNAKYILKDPSDILKII